MRAPLFRGFSLLPGERSGRFAPGHRHSPRTEVKPGERLSPATEFKPGERPSVATEFKPGNPAHNKLPVGSVRVRKETHTGLLRAWVKTAEPNVWRKRAVIVWEAIHGHLPNGSVVHHVDRDSLNDDPGNLQGLTRKEHTAEHRTEIAVGAARAALA